MAPATHVSSLTATEPVHSRKNPASTAKCSRTQEGDDCEGAAVAELTHLVDLTGWPAGTRLIVRREPLHPGAQGSLFPSLQFRYWGHYTDSDLDPVAADVAMRAHARVEDNIRRFKDSGASRFPFSNLEANRAHTSPAREPRPPNDRANP